MVAQPVVPASGWIGFRALNGDDADARAAATDLTNLLDAVEVPIVVLRRNFTIAGFNKATADEFQLSPSDIGRASRDISRLAGLPSLEAQCSEVMASGVELAAPPEDGIGNRREKLTQCQQQRLRARHIEWRPVAGEQLAFKDTGFV